MTNEEMKKDIEMEAEEQFTEGEIDDNEAEAAAGGFVRLGTTGGPARNYLGGGRVDTGGSRGKVLGGGRVDMSGSGGKLKKSSIYKTM